MNREEISTAYAEEETSAGLTRQLGELREQAAKTTEIIRALGERLSPVLRQEPTAASRALDGDANAPRSPLGDQASEVYTLLRTHQRLLSDLMGSVDL